jgi:hypothetical protein
LGGQPALAGSSPDPLFASIRGSKDLALTASASSKARTDFAVRLRCQTTRKSQVALESENGTIATPATGKPSRQIFLGPADEAFSAQFLHRNAFSRSQRMIGCHDRNDR